MHYTYLAVLTIFGTGFWAVMLGFLPVATLHFLAS